MKEPRFYELDTIAKYFYGILDPKMPPVFGFTAVLTEAVDPAILGRALKDVLSRFPYFDVALSNGFFWPRFRHPGPDIAPAQGSGIPSIAFGKDKPLFGVAYEGRKIHLKLLHLLGDGYGGLALLTVLLTRYFALTGVPVPAGQCGFDLMEPPDPGEYENALPMHFRPGRHRTPPAPRAYHVAGRILPRDETTIITGIMDAGDVVRAARGRGASVTEYLSAVLVQSLLEQQTSEGPAGPLPVVLSVSADLRRQYPSKTLRNHAFFANIGVEPGGADETFDAVLAELERQLRSLLREDNLRDRIGENMRYFNLLRGLPRSVKRLIIQAVYRYNEKTFTANLTNMGAVALPPALQDRVERLETVGSNTPAISLKCGVISCGGRLTAAFTGILNHTMVQDRFFATLAREGIPVRVERCQGATDREPEKCGELNENVAFGE